MIIIINNNNIIIITNITNNCISPKTNIKELQLKTRRRQMASKVPGFMEDLFADLRDSFCNDNKRSTTSTSPTHRVLVTCRRQVYDTNKWMTDEKRRRMADIVLQNNNLLILRETTEMK